MGVEHQLKTVHVKYNVKMIGKHLNQLEFWKNFIFIFFSFSRTQWIYDSSDVIYPSIYMSEQINSYDRVKMVRGRIRESIRLAKRSRNARKVIAYFRYVFTDTKRFISRVS